MLSPFISGKTSRELLQGPEKGGGLGFPQPKGLPLCLGVGAGCEDPGGQLRCAWRPGLPELAEDLCVGPGDPRRRPSPVLPSPQFLPHPDSPRPLSFSSYSTGPREALTGTTLHGEEPRPSGQASTSPHSASGPGPLHPFLPLPGLPEPSQVQARTSPFISKPVMTPPKP